MFYNETVTRTRRAPYPLTVDHIGRMAYTMERILRGNTGEAWTEEQCDGIREALLPCTDDPQRLMVMDWMAYTHVPIVQSPGEVFSTPPHGGMRAHGIT